MLDGEQRRVLRGMVLAMAITVAVLGLGGALAWPALPVLPGVADRLGFALRCDLLVVIWLVAAVAAVARGRFFSAADIDGAGFGLPGARIALASAVLQNTLEQAVLAVTVHLGLASLLRGRELVLVLVLVGLFCAGRLAFWMGYRHGAGGRALGFGLTFYPSVLGLGVALLLLAIRE